MMRKSITFSGIALLLLGIGEQIGKMLRTDNRDAAGDPGARYLMPLPTDASVDVEQRNARKLQPMFERCIVINAFDRDAATRSPCQ